MVEDIREHPEAANPEVRHEEADINVRAVLWFGVIMVVFSVVTAFGLWALFRYYQTSADQNEPRRMTAMPAANNDLPPAPRLQTNPPADLQAFVREEDERLSSYGWVDRKSGVAHIPIDEAMKLVLERHQLKGPAAGTTDGSAAETESTPLPADIPPPPASVLMKKGNS